MPQKDVSSSTAMIAGYAQMDMLKGFRKFRVNVIGQISQPLPAFSLLVPKYELWNREVTNALVTVYAKCRSTDKADVKPDSTTFAKVPSASIKMGALEEGVDIH
ncbi:uncharacterized protein LOC131068340 [Cryptomeria japonica]|uniref:uncharacterized protein LOC131068340 n=1 Tax=Cryptomeria japonica TaxID=3369 RepID=UPI0027DA17D8|nr:uncharacterized protein LOC131068340 [Cryptomeria japonica]